MHCLKHFRWHQTAAYLGAITPTIDDSFDSKLTPNIAWISGRSLRLNSACFSDTQKLGSIEDTAAFFLELETGAPVHIVLCWRKGTGQLDCQLTIIGSKGTLKASPWGKINLEAGEASRKKAFFPKDSTISERALIGMKGAIIEFVRAVEEKRRPDPAPEDSLTSQALIEQAYRQW